METDVGRLRAILGALHPSATEHGDLTPVLGVPADPAVVTDAVDMNLATDGRRSPFLIDAVLFRAEALQELHPNPRELADVVERIEWLESFDSTCD